MKTTEQILVAIAVLGLIVSLSLWPGGNIALVLSLSLLSLIYFVFGFALFNDIRLKNIFKSAAYKNSNALQIVAGVFTGIAMSTAVIGLLFVALRWPGGNVILLQGMIAAGIITLIAAIKYSSKNNKMYLLILRRVLPVFLLSLLLYFFSTQIFIKFKYREYPEFVQAYERAEENPHDTKLWEEVDKHDPSRLPDYETE